MTWLQNKYVSLLTLVLLAQCALFYAASRGEKTPSGQPLDRFPAQVADWREIENYPVEQEVRDQLKADDLMNRLYGDDTTHTAAGLFVAYFKTQRTGQSPHSPKNCLPGSGWEPEATGFVDVPVAEEPAPIRINRYVVSHGDEKSVVLYWYQSPRHIIASEFSAKFWLVLDSIRYRRSDTALVRVTVPVVKNEQVAATQTAIGFVRSFFPVLKAYLPS